MLRIIFLFALCTGVLAERLTLVDLTDPKSNLLFSQLAQYRGTSQTQAEAIATATAANSILKQLAPSIVLLPGYTGLFTGNCSMLFNNQLEGVACDINPASAHDLTAGASAQVDAISPRNSVRQTLCFEQTQRNQSNNRLSY